MTQQSINSTRLEILTDLNYKISVSKGAPLGVIWSILNIEQTDADKISELSDLIGYTTATDQLLPLLPIWTEAAKKVGLKSKISIFGSRWSVGYYLVKFLMWAHFAYYQSVGPYKYMLQFGIKKIDINND